MHCKSGKGRSATTVVGARAALVIDTYAEKMLRDKGLKKLTRSQVNQIIDEQIAQVLAARKEVSISWAQKVNLRQVLFERAGISRTVFGAVVGTKAAGVLEAEL